MPKKNGAFGGIFWSSSEYDGDATQAILKSIRKHKLIKPGAIFFNDPKLITEGLCTHLGGHDHHIHFEINPPLRT